MSSNLMEIFGTILDQPDDLKVSPIKLEVLRVIALLSVGGRLFSQSDISLTPIPEEQDQLLLQRLQAMLLGYDLIFKVFN